MFVFINYLTGTKMLVADERKDEYLRAGYMLANTSEEQKPAEAPVEKPVKKAGTKKKK